MTRRLTTVTVAAVALVAWALWLGVVSGRAELFLVAVPWLAVLVRAGGRRGAPAYTLVHEVSAARVYEGDRVTVTVTLTATTSVAQIEVVEALPPWVQVARGRPRTVLALTAGEHARWTYDLAFPVRMRARLGILHVRMSDPSGLDVAEGVHRDPKVVEVYPRPAPLRLLVGPLRTQTSIGNYVSRVVGEGLEPGEIRPFVPGDRVKHVHWRASLRRNQLYVTHHQEERNADVVLMLDTLAHAGSGTATTLNACVRAAASLASAYLARKDRVGLVEYGGILRWMRPGSGRMQFERLLDILLRAEVTFTYVTRDVTLVPPRVLPPQALVIALTPLLDARFIAAASDLAARGFDLVVLAVDPIGFARASFRSSLLVETGARLWWVKRQLELDELRRRGLRVLDWDPEEAVDVALSRLARAPRRPAVAG